MPLGGRCSTNPFFYLASRVRPCRRVVLASYFGLTKDRVALEVVAHLFKALFSPTMNLPPIQNTEDLFE